ncbi:MAG: ABC transporter permease [Candidatus Abawacabacteria bacterium]|nr:ABC transporter permease [Candidatus Abawacabacteria bacterium]
MKKNSFWQLLWVIAANDFKLRYYGSYLGYLWSLLKPLSLFGVMWFVFSTFVRWDIPNYQLYLLLGIMIWNFFTESTTMGLGSLASKIGIIKKVYFPRIIVVLASTVSAFIGLFFNLLVFLLFALFAGLSFTTCVFLFPLLLIPLYILTVGISLTLAALYIKFRDINQIWEVVVQLGFWLSPIVYPLHFVPEKYQFFLLLNPITGIIQYARLLLVEGALPSMAGWVYIYIAALVVFAVGLLTFSYLEPRAAEEL